MPTTIAWAEESWNPLRARNREDGRVGHFCVHASAGCAGCYAEAFQLRLGTGVRYRAQDRGRVELYLDEAALTAPLRWKRPRRIFVCSQTDLFLDDYPEAWIDRIMAVALSCPRHVFIVLTKRAARQRAYWTDPETPGRIAWQAVAMSREPRFDWPLVPLPNVWSCVSVEDQEQANRRVPELLATPAAVRGVSAEPLLEAVDLTRFAVQGSAGRNALTGEFYGVQFENAHQRGTMTVKTVPRVHWLIVGGESKTQLHAPRPFDLAWARQAIADCQAAGVAVFMKQLGQHAVEDGRRLPPTVDRKGEDPAEWPADLRVRDYPR